MRYLKVILISFVFLASFQTPTAEEIIDRVVDIDDVRPKTFNIGEFRITAYCHCEKCCGKTDGITSTGTRATANRTVAVDTNIIPYGSIVIIDGKEYVAEDCGGAIKGKRIDVYFDTHKEALEFGVKYADVYKVVN